MARSVESKQRKNDLAREKYRALSKAQRQELGRKKRQARNSTDETRAVQAARNAEYRWRRRYQRLEALEADGKLSVRQGRVLAQMRHVAADAPVVKPDRTELLVLPVHDLTPEQRRLRRREQQRLSALRRRDALKQAKPKRMFSCQDCGVQVTYRRKGVGRCWACYKKDVRAKADARRYCRECHVNRVYQPGNRCRVCYDREANARYAALNDKRAREQARQRLQKRQSPAQGRAIDAQQLREKRIARRRPDKWYMEFAPGEEWALESTCTGRTMQQVCTNGLNGLPARILYAGMCYTCATGRPRKYRAIVHPPKNLSTDMAEDLKFAEELVA